VVTTKLVRELRALHPVAASGVLVEGGSAERPPCQVAGASNTGLFLFLSRRRVSKQQMNPDR